MIKDLISIISPIYNEEGNISQLVKEINNVMQENNYNYELIFVDDGSIDKSWNEIISSKTENDKIKAIRLARNYGQSIALQSGLDNAKGGIIIFIDGDLQNDPKDISKLIEKIKQGYDVVSGWRYKRKDPFFRKCLPSEIGNLLIRFLTGVKLHDFGCTLKAYKKEVIKDIKLLGEMHRLIPLYAYQNGAKICEIKVNHRKRKKGKSKYGYSRAIKLLLDLILNKFFISFVSKPIYIFGSMGIGAISISLLISGFVLYRKISLGGEWLSPLFFISVTLFTVGVELILMGIIAEILVRIYYQSKFEEPYKIKEKIS
jgi:glycosyltransferase involved in cell wall biosynthesis